MKKSSEELYQGILKKIQEEALKEVIGMDSKTLDSLLCKSCLVNGNPQQCDKLMQFGSTADCSKNGRGEIGNMIYMYRICGYTLAEYRKNKEEKK